MKHSPNWQPARDIEKNAISVFVRERVLVEADERGKISSVKRCNPDACKNTLPNISDSNMVVPNPEKLPQYKELEGKSILRAIQENMPKDTWFYLNTSFVVDKEGKVRDIKMGADNTCPDSAVMAVLEKSNWIAATQGGQSVNSYYRLRGLLKNSERKHTFHTSDYYPDFMMGGDLPPFEYDPSSKRLQKRWSKLQEAYPVLKGDINGYAKSRRLNKSIYKELMIRKGR